MAASRSTTKVQAAARANRQQVLGFGTGEITHARGPARSEDQCLHAPDHSVGRKAEPARRYTLRHRERGSSPTSRCGSASGVSRQPGEWARVTDARRELIFGALGLAILAVVAVVLVTQASGSLPGFGDESPTVAASPGASVPPLPSPTPTPSPAPTPTPTPLPQTYTVQSGDTLQLIAERFSVTIDDLAAKNGILDPNNIFAGQKLELPQPDERVTQPPAPEPDGEQYHREG